MLAILYTALFLPLVATLLLALAKTIRSIERIHLASSVVTAFSLVLVGVLVHTDGPFRHEILYVDELSCVLLMVVAILVLTAALFSLSYMDREAAEEGLSRQTIKRYYILLHIFTFTMICVPVVENLGLMWVAVEATTLSSALLVAFSFSRPSIEAAWKYVMICTVGLCLALLGTILLYFAQLNTGLEAGEALSWLALQKVGRQLPPDIVKTAFVFIIIGYGAKAGLAPMHTWLPDAHSQAPSPISGLLSGALLSCAMYVIMRNVAIVRDTTAFPFIQELLLGLGVLSVGAVIPFLLVQHDLKRLLAYSSVEHMGIVAIALGIGTPLAIYGGLLHVLNHAIAKSSLFYLAGIITQEYRTKQILRIRGLLFVMPRVGRIFLLFVLIITGAPPFGIFFSKLLITWAAFLGGFKLVGTGLLVLLGAVFAGIMYYCLQMVFSVSTGMVRTKTIGAGAVAALTISTVLITLSGWYLPEVLETALRQAAVIITGG